MLGALIKQVKKNWMCLHEERTCEEIVVFIGEINWSVTDWPIKIKVNFTSTIPIIISQSPPLC